MKDKFCVKKNLLLIAGIFFIPGWVWHWHQRIIFTRNYLFYRQLIEKRERQ